MDSYWIKKKQKNYPPIQADTECEICIVGGGMSGLLCAYQLQDKYKVILIESDEIGSGASGRNTGKVSSQHGFSYQHLLQMHGRAKTMQYYKANQEAIEKLKHLIEKEHLSVDWQEKASIVGCQSIENTKLVADEMKAYDVCELHYEVVQQDEVQDIRYGARFLHQATMDPYAFCTQLAAKLHIEIYEHSAFTEQKENYILCNNHKIFFNEIIFATQVMPFRMPPFYLVTTPLQSYLAALQPAVLPSTMIYVEETMTLTKNRWRDVDLIGGYEHHVDEDKEKYLKKMERTLKNEHSKQDILTIWASQDYRSSDYLPLVGKINKMYVITGFNKWGNTNAYVASEVIRDLITKKENVMSDILDPTRFSLYLNLNFVEENARMMNSFIQSKLQDPTFQLPNKNEGIAVMIDHHPYGIYYDEQYHIVDLICPHLGCTLTFNHEMKTWDCPCHGSIFDIDGQIVKGPARECLHSRTL